MASLIVGRESSVEREHRRGGYIPDDITYDRSYDFNSSLTPLDHIPIL